jgi:hypothetical protein
MDVLWDVALCNLVDMDGDHPDDGDSKHLWNTSQYLPDYTVQHPRRQPSSHLKSIQIKLSDMTLPLSRFFNENFVHSSVFSHILHVPPISTWFNQPNNITEQSELCGVRDNTLPLYLKGPWVQYWPRNRLSFISCRLHQGKCSI